MTNFIDPKLFGLPPQTKIEEISTEIIEKFKDNASSVSESFKTSNQGIFDNYTSELDSIEGEEIEEQVRAA